jgi:uncharacterized protein YybS (DUF2232 family)
VVIPYFQIRQNAQNDGFSGFLLLTAILLLPTLLPGKMGWLTSLVPLPVFYYLVVLGQRRGLIITRNALLLSGGAALLFGSMPVLIFTFSMVPLGIAFFQALNNRKTPVNAGLVGALFLCLTWTTFWSVLGFIHQMNPYASLLTELDAGLTGSLLLYEESAELAPETLHSVKIAVEALRTYIPKILPGLLVSGILTITWLNLALGNMLLQRKDKGLSPWPEYNAWKLPDPLVWLVIMGGISVFLLPTPLSTLGLNVLIICTTLYFFQGLAIIVSLLDRWSVPRLIRALIYALIFIQTYGIIVLSFLGLADVWADFRKLNNTGENQETAG